MKKVILIRQSSWSGSLELIVKPERSLGIEDKEYKRGETEMTEELKSIKDKLYSPENSAVSEV